MQLLYRVQKIIRLFMQSRRLQFFKKQFFGFWGCAGCGWCVLRAAYRRRMGGLTGVKPGSSPFVVSRPYWKLWEVLDM